MAAFKRAKPGARQIPLVEFVGSEKLLGHPPRPDDVIHTGREVIGVLQPVQRIDRISPGRLNGVSQPAVRRLGQRELRRVSFLLLGQYPCRRSRFF